MRNSKKKRMHRVRFSVLLLTLVTFFCAALGTGAVSAEESDMHNQRVIVGGEVFGTRINTKGVLVVGVTGVVSEKKERFPARDAGICSRDIIKTVDGSEIINGADLVSRIEKSGGKTLEIGILRDGKEIKVDLAPIMSDRDGAYRGGLWIRDSLAGIGTVTFIIPETGAFAGLGHGICDPDTGILMPVSGGGIYGVVLGELKKGTPGEPGELRGRLGKEKLGSVVNNCQSGIYGVFSDLPQEYESVEIAGKEDVKTGKASVICTVDENGPRQYSAQIEKICDADGEIKNFTVKITDERLLSVTGGIVQGMSGSPIIQNGKLIGAVTHVMINDPTTGYGIFIENMLNAAQMPMAKAS